MKIKYIGPLFIDDLFQAIYQDRKEIFQKYGIERARAASLYFTPVDEFGEVMTIRDAKGNPMAECVSSGPYFSGAAEYDRGPVVASPIATGRRVLRP